jgi:hypothetical protein
MKKVLLSAVAAFTLAAASAQAADMPVKARPVVAPPPPAWDIAFGAAVASDYIFRGITQSDHKPSVSGYFEPRWNIHPDWQLYVGVGGASIKFPNSADAEIDFYGGIRPTFGKLALDLGVLYYYYPGGRCRHGNALFGADCVANGGALPNGNVIKKDLSFLEGYFRGLYNVSDAFVLGFNTYFTDSFLNSGAEGFYGSGTAKYTFPAFSNGIAVFLSGELGWQYLGTSDSFYSIAGAPGAPGINYKDYATWNLGGGFTWKAATLDLRYFDTNLSKGDCNAFTSDHTATQPGNVTAINPGGIGSNWCSPAFVAKLSVDFTVQQHLLAR